MPEAKPATIHVDGRAFTVPAGQSLLQACLELGFHLPYFCWHPAMGSVGACRQCAVLQYKDEKDEAAGRGRLVMACMTAAAEGARIGLAEPTAAAFRAAVIEGMMLHHPHDCPVCDEGGHCHLQDMTVMAGHNTRRYRFRKRTFRNQYLGPFLNHEMNRCIQCYRCHRFYREYAGGSDFDAFGLSDRVFFGRERDGVLESEFAGNLAEVCPTGVFTDATLKQHYTRKWDLRWSPAVCVHCGLGCNISPGVRYGSVRAVINRYHGEVNRYFLCDRGRFGHQYLGSPRRVRAARWQGAAVDAATALEKLAGLLRAAPPGQAIGIGSPRASLESNFALRRLVGEERFFAGVEAAQLELARRMLKLMRAGVAHTPSLSEIEACDAVLVLGEDLTQTAARMALSLRQSALQQPMRQISDPLQIPRWLDHAAREAIQDARGPLFVATPAPTKLDAIAAACHRAVPGDIARLGCEVAHQLVAEAPGAPEWGAAAKAIAAALLQAERPLVIAGASGSCLAVVEAAAAVAAALAQRGKRAALSYVPPECNSLGLALLRPRPLAEALELAHAGAAAIAIVLENDLFRRAPAERVEAFLASFGPGRPRHLIVLDQITHRTAEAAELLLPAASFAEGDGTLVNHEGRAQRSFQVLAPDPAIRESWRWLEQAQARDPSLDELIGGLAAAFPELGAVRQAAPPASFRLAGQKVPRETHRFSGRTAIHAGAAVSEPKPPEDADTALSFTMEGYEAQPPAALTPFFWAPGWNSPQAAFTYQQEINAALRGGDAGARLFAGNGAAPLQAWPQPPAAFTPRAGAWWLVRLHHLFGSEELSQLGEAIAQLAPPPYVALSAAAAAEAGWAPGLLLQIEVNGSVWQAPLWVAPDLPAGTAAVPAGVAEFDGAALPAWCRLTAAGGRS